MISDCCVKTTFMHNFWCLNMFELIMCLHFTVKCESIYRRYEQNLLKL